MSDINLDRIARLARLHFEGPELDVFLTQVKDVLKFADELKEVDVQGVEPTSHPLSLKNVFREDEVRPSVSIEEFLKHAPSAYKRFFEVPKIIEDNK